MGAKALKSGPKGPRLRNQLLVNRHLHRYQPTEYAYDAMVVLGQRPLPKTLDIYFERAGRDVSLHSLGIWRLCQIRGIEQLGMNMPQGTEGPRLLEELSNLRESSAPQRTRAWFSQYQTFRDRDSHYHRFKQRRWMLQRLRHRAGRRHRFP